MPSDVPSPRFGITKRRSGDGRTVVELIRITDPRAGRDVERLRIKRDGFFLADVRSWEEATKLGVDIADLQAT